MTIPTDPLTTTHLFLDNLRRSYSRSLRQDHWRLTARIITETLRSRLSGHEIAAILSGTVAPLEPAEAFKVYERRRTRRLKAIYSVIALILVGMATMTGFLGGIVVGIFITAPESKLVMVSPEHAAATQQAAMAICTLIGLLFGVRSMRKAPKDVDPISDTSYLDRFTTYVKNPSLVPQEHQLSVWAAVLATIADLEQVSLRTLLKDGFPA